MTSAAVFLPWRGEFGTMLMHHVRRVHDHPAPRKVVFCRRGLEALFPTATEFCYDWDDYADKDKKGKTLKSRENADYLDAIAGRAMQRWPGCSIVFPRIRTKPNDYPQFIVKPKENHFLPPVDICVGPRYREHGTHRNYQHWEEVIDRLISVTNGLGLNVALLGAKATSIDHSGVPYEYKAWNYPNDISVEIQFMQSSRLMLATDSGLAHLAVLAGVPLKVIYDKPGKEAGHPTWPWALPFMQAQATNHCQPILYGWSDPDAVITAVGEFTDW